VFFQSFKIPADQQQLFSFVLGDSLDSSIQYIIHGIEIDKIPPSKFNSQTKKREKTKEISASIFSRFLRNENSFLKFITRKKFFKFYLFFLKNPKNLKIFYSFFPLVFV